MVVTNPAPGGGASNSVNFTVNNPAPTLTLLTLLTAGWYAGAPDAHSDRDELPLHLDGDLQRGGAPGDVRERDAVDDFPERDGPGDGGKLRGGGDESCAGWGSLEPGGLCGQ